MLFPNFLGVNDLFLIVVFYFRKMTDKTLMSLEWLKTKNKGLKIDFSV